CRTVSSSAVLPAHHLRPSIITARVARADAFETYCSHSRHNIDIQVQPQRVSVERRRWTMETMIDRLDEMEEDLAARAFLFDHPQTYRGAISIAFRQLRVELTVKAR